MFRRTLSVLCATSIFALGVNYPLAVADKLPPKSGKQLKQFLADKPVQLQAHYTVLAEEGERNAVLNFMRIGLAAMDLGEDVLAAKALDEALLRIETVYADNANAAKARSKFVKESKKDFKGEPYERAMVYYYRGLLYLKQGDYENARASFRGGLLQDSFAEDQTYAQDIAFFDVLSGWSSQCLGSTTQAQEFYDRARSARPAITTPGADDRVLLLADIGAGPYKISDGKYGENLRFRQDVNFAERSVVFSSPEIAASVVDMIVGAEVDLAGVREATRIANLTSKAKEARALASEADADLAEIALRALPPDPPPVETPAVAATAAAPPAALPLAAAPPPTVPPAATPPPVEAPTPAASQTQPGPSGPQEAPVQPQRQEAPAQPKPQESASTVSSNAEFAAQLRDVLASARTGEGGKPDATGAPMPAVDPALAPPPEPPVISERERRTLAARTARDTATSARAEVAGAQAAAAKANAELAASEELAASGRRMATTIGADLSAVPAAVEARLRAPPPASAAPAAPPAVPLPAPPTATAEAPLATANVVAASVSGVPARRIQPLYSQRGESLYFQASTRGGRPVDGILAGKAEFKASTQEFADTTGDISLAAVQTANSLLQQQMNFQAQGFAVDTSGAQAAAGIGLAFAAASLFSSAMSAAAKPQADIRYWDNLPAELQVAYGPISGSYTATFLGDGGQRLAPVPVRVTMDQAGRCGIGWIRSQPAAQIPPSAPNSDGKKK